MAQAEKTDSNKSSPSSRYTRRRSMQRSEFRRAEPRRIEGPYTVVNGHLETSPEWVLPHNTRGSGIRGGDPDSRRSSARNFIERVRSRRAGGQNNNVSDELDLEALHNEVHVQANMTEHNDTSGIIHNTTTSTQQQEDSHDEDKDRVEDDEDISDEDRSNLVRAFSGPSREGRSSSGRSSSGGSSRRANRRRSEILDRVRSARSESGNRSREKLLQRLDKLESRYIGRLKRELSNLDSKERAIILSNLQSRFQELRSEKNIKLTRATWRKVKQEMKDLAAELQEDARKTSLRRRERTEIATEEIIAAFYKRLDGLGVESAPAIAKDLNEKILWDLNSGMKREAILMKLVHEVQSDLRALKKGNEDTSNDDQAGKNHADSTLEGDVVVRAFSGPVQMPMPMPMPAPATNLDEEMSTENTSASDELSVEGSDTTTVKEPYIDTITTAMPLALDFTNSTESHL